MKRKIIALLQARTDSSRLPKKVLKSILNKPMIIHQMERTLKSKLIDELVLVTSNQASDDELSKIILKHQFNVIRGDKDNVLKRFYDASLEFNLNDDDIIVRLTGDCPIHDAVIIDETIQEFLNQKCDYLSNCVKPVYPDGLDVEVFTFESLKNAYYNATKKSDLEHVTPYIRNNSQLKVLDFNKNPLHTDWRLTVDEEIDFILIKKIYEHFNSSFFSFSDIVDFLENNIDLLRINSSINRNEGYKKSLKEDNDNKL